MNPKELEQQHTETRDREVDSGKYAYFHMIRDTQTESITIKGYDTYPRSSVLAGQTRINFIDSFEAFEESLMMKLWGQHAEWSNKYIEPQNTFNHLPDEGDGW